MADIFDSLQYQMGTTGALYQLPRVKNHSLWNGERQFTTSKPWNGRGLQINRIYRDSVKYTVEFMLTSGASGSYADTFNQLFDMFQADVEARNPGRLWLGSWSIECYGDMSREFSMMPRRYDGSGFAQVEVTFVCPSGMWEKQQELTPLAASGNNKNFVNNLGSAATIRVKWSATQTNPQFTITSVTANTYAISGTIVTGQTLWIDGATSTVWLEYSDGTLAYADNMLTCASASTYPTIAAGASCTVQWVGSTTPQMWLVRSQDFPRWEGV